MLCFQSQFSYEPIQNAVQEDWLQRVCPTIQERMSRYSASEIRFNLLAVVRKRSEVLQEQLQALDGQSTPPMDTDDRSAPASTSSAEEDAHNSAVRQS